MRDTYPTGLHDPCGQKEPFKNFFTLFQCTLQQMREQGANDYVVYVLAREAVSKGIIPAPFLDPFKQAINQRNAASLQSLLYHIRDYYSALPA